MIPSFCLRLKDSSVCLLLTCPPMILVFLKLLAIGAVGNISLPLYGYLKQDMKAISQSITLYLEKGWGGRGLEFLIQI
jgi:hypothetical protein